MNNAAVNTAEQMSLWYKYGYMHKSGIAES